jgi:hypothetical protein
MGQGKFSYKGGRTKDWGGLQPDPQINRIVVTAKCRCGATESETSFTPLPPQAFTKKFTNNGWRLGRHPTCPACRTSPPKEKQVSETARPPLAAVPPAPPPKIEPSDAAKAQRRMAFIAVEAAYDENNRRYRDGHTDETVAKEVGCVVKIVVDVREQFFGPAAPPEPPEFAALRGQIVQAAAQFATAKSHLAASQTNLTNMTDAFNRIAKANGWPVL